MKKIQSHWGSERTRSTSIPFDGLGLDCTVIKCAALTMRVLWGDDEAIQCPGSRPLVENFGLSGFDLLVSLGREIRGR